MDFQEKAKAIWAALDNMAEKNPESYRQFIHDQLHGDGAEEMWKQLGLNNPLDNARPGSTDSVESEKLKKRDGSKGQASRIPSSRTRSVLTTSNASRLPGHSDRSGPPVESQEGPSSSQHDLSTSLLDDSFSHSSLLINPLLVGKQTNELTTIEII